MRAVRDMLAWLGLLLSVGLLIGGWKTMPAVIAVHFDASGMPNGYGSKYVLLLMVGIGVLVYLALLVGGRFPERFNLSAKVGDPDRPRQEAAAAEMVAWLRLEIAWLFAYLTWGEVEIARHARVGLGSWLMPVVAIVAVATVAMFFAQIFRGARHSAG